MYGTRAVLIVHNLIKYLSSTHLYICIYKGDVLIHSTVPTTFHALVKCMLLDQKHPPFSMPLKNLRF